MVPLSWNPPPQNWPRKNCLRIWQELVFVSSDGWFFYLAPVIFRFLDRLYNITSSSCMINPCPQNQTGICQIRINHPQNQTGVCQNGKTCPYSRPGTKNQPRFFMNVNQVLWNLKTEFLWLKTGLNGILKLLVFLLIRVFEFEVCDVCSHFLHHWKLSWMRPQQEHSGTPLV